MVSGFTKWLFAVTAISPAFGAAAITAASAHGNWMWFAVWTVVGVLSALVSWLIILFVRRHVEKATLNVQEIDLADQRVLEFLIAYLLPVFSATSISTLAGSVALTAYSLFVVSLAVAYGNVFQFNPVLSLFGYHFYVVKSDDKIKYLLVSKHHFHRAERTVTYRKIAEYVLLDATP